ncbi:MAG: hypothetical protein ACLFR1_03190 [Spirochaetia bacterium]
MAMNVVEKINNKTKVQNVLISVFDKTDLDVLVHGLVRISPDVTIYSTGGSYRKIKEILGGDSEKNLCQVSEYTGQPEMQGGLVKTLDFKIYLGLLHEPYNQDHLKDLERTDAKSIDMVVVNLYPFQQVIAQADATIEGARGNIDIGGPCMLRASAKNFIRVASVCDPVDYPKVISSLEKTDGSTSLDLRFELAKKAFSHTAEYDAAIARYLMKADYSQLSSQYQFQDSQG